VPTSFLSVHPIGGCIFTFCLSVREWYPSDFCLEGTVFECRQGRRMTEMGVCDLTQLGDRSSIPGKGREFFSSLPRPDRLWEPSNLLSNWNRWLFRRG